MNSYEKESKVAVVVEENKCISDFLKQTIRLIGFDSVVIREVFSFEISEFQNCSIFTNINNLNQLSQFLENQKIEKIQTILYQTSDDKVTNFWYNGIIGREKILPKAAMIYVRTRGKLEKIYKNDILYVESDKKYCTIVTEQKKYVIRTALKNIDSQLKDKRFIRVHRSYLINQDHIQYIDTQNLNIEIGKQKIAIGRRFQEDLFKQLMILH